MRHGMIALAVVLTIAGGDASAGAAIDAGIVQVEVVDRFGSGCGLPACVANSSAQGGLGDGEVDIRQAIYHVGVGTDWDAVNLPVATPIPSWSKRLNTSDVAVANPAWGPVGAATGTLRPAWAGSGFDVVIHSWGVEVVGVAPSVRNQDARAPDTALHPYHRGQPVGGSLGGRDVDGVTERGGSSLDDMGPPAVRASCAERVTRAACEATGVEGTVGIVQATTPNVRWGLDVYSVEAATDPSLLTGPAAVGHDTIADIVANGSVSMGSTPTRSFDRARSGAATEPLRRPAATAPPWAGGGEASIGPASSDQRLADTAASGAPVPSPLPDLLAVAAAAAVTLGVLLVLYRRLERGDVTASSTRDRLLRLVHERPGVRAAEAARALGVHRSVVDHHARVLADFGLVVVRTDLRQRRLFAAGTQPRDAGDAALIACLADPVAGAILRRAAISPTPRARAREGLDVPSTTFHWHVRRLLRLGFLRESGDGLDVAASVRDALAAQPPAAVAAAVGAR